MATRERVRLRAAPWPPGGKGQKFRHERLVWLAARPELSRLGRPWWLAVLAATGAGSRASYFAHANKKELGSARMQRLAIIAEDLAPKLSPEERVRLQQTGELPEWFYLAVEQEWRR